MSLDLKFIAALLVATSINDIIPGKVSFWIVLIATAILAFINYEIANDLIKIFRAKRMPTGILTFNMIAVIAVGVVSFLILIESDVIQFIAFLIGCIAAPIFIIAQILTGIQLSKVGATSLCCMIIVSMVVSMGSIAIIDGLNPRKDKAGIIILYLISVGVQFAAYYFYNKFFQSQDGYIEEQVE